MKQYEKYRDSGVKWIGDIPDHWKTLQLRRITKNVKTGTTPKGASEIYFSDNGLCWFTPSDFGNNYCLSNSEKHLSVLGEKEVKVFPKNTILMIGIGGTMGKVALAKVPCSSNQQINAIITNEMIIPFYLVYYLKCMQDNIFNTAKYTTLPILNQLETKKIPIPIPPLSEQCAIVSYLDTKVGKIDKYISVAEKKIAAHEELKQTIIADAVTHGTNPNAKMKDSSIKWIGLIPEHWETIRLKRTVDIINKKSIDNSIPYIALENIESYTGQLLSLSNIKPDSTCNAFKKDDILFCKLRPYLTKCVLTTYDGKCTSELLVLRNFSGANKYLNYILLSPRLIADINASTYGSKMPRANWNYIGSCAIPFPPLSEQRTIVSYLDRKVSQIDKMLTAEQSQIAKLKEYKQRLISDVVTGKIKVQ